MDWQARIAQLPPGANFAALLEGLRMEESSLAQQLEAVDARHAGPIADLSIDEARSQLAAALQVVRRPLLRDAINALVAGGLESDVDRARYDTLTAMFRRLFEATEG